MRYYSIICTIMLLCSAFHAQGQQVNPFELRTSIDSSSIPQDSASSFSTSNGSIIVIEDSLQKPSILPEVETETASTLVNAESVEATVNTEEVSPIQVTPEESVASNPFELIQVDGNKEVDEFIEDGLPPKDSADSSISLDVIDSSDAESIVPVDVTLDDESVEQFINKHNEVPVPAKSKNLLVFWASLFCGLLVAVSLNAKNNILLEIWKSFRNLNYMKLLQKEQKNGWSSPYIILFIVYLINVSIFVRFLAIEYKVPILEYSLWKIGLFITALVALRHISLYVIAFMRKRLSEPLNYNFIIISVNIMTGLLLLPINLFIAFSNDSISSAAISGGIIILCLSLVIRWFRAFVNSLRIIIGDSFHFLLYLCSCEIVPIIIVVGYVRNLIN